MSAEVINKERILRPSTKQVDVFRNGGHSFNILSGVTRSGKTFAQAMLFHKFMQTVAPKNSLHLMTGKTSESLYDNLVRPILELDTKNRVVVNGKKSMLYYDGSKEVRLVGCDNERAADRIKGKTVYSWWADEITSHPESLVDMAITRCSAKGIQRPKVWTCNPDNPNHFIKTRFIDSDVLDVKNWYFGFPDNPTLTDELLTELKSAFHGAFYDRMILGLWTVAEGIVYKMFDQAKHIISMDKVPWKRIERYVMGLDWGYTHSMGVTLYAIDKDGVWYQINEFKEPGRQVDKHLIEELSSRGFLSLPILRWDGAMWREYKVSPEVAYGDSARPEYIELFGKLSGITTRPAIKPEKMVMINEVMSMYSKNLLFHTDNCKKTINEKMAYRFKDGKHDEIFKDDDELVDCEQYAIYTDQAGKVTRIKG